MEITLSEKDLDKVAEEIVQKVNEYIAMRCVSGYAIPTYEEHKEGIETLIKETILGLSVVRK